MAVNPILHLPSAPTRALQQPLMTKVIGMGATPPRQGAARDTPKLRHRELDNITLRDEAYRAMSHDQMLDWLAQLPSIDHDPDIPEWMEEAITKFASDPDRTLAEAEAHATRWERRKAELKSDWDRQRELLPQHIQTCLGEQKNLLLWEELIEWADIPDERLLEHLWEGFPILGELERSHTAEPDEDATAPTMAPEELLKRAIGTQNKETIRRATNGNFPAEVVQVMDDKTSEDIENNIAIEVSPRTAGDGLLSLRFPKDEGYRRKQRPNGEEYLKRKVRCCNPNVVIS